MQKCLFQSWQSGMALQHWYVSLAPVKPLDWHFLFEPHHSFPGISTGWVSFVHSNSCLYRWGMSHIPQQVRWKQCVNYPSWLSCLLPPMAAPHIELNSDYSSHCPSSGAPSQVGINHPRIEGVIQPQTYNSPHCFMPVGLGACQPLCGKLCLPFFP